MKSTKGTEVRPMSHAEKQTHPQSDSNPAIHAGQVKTDETAPGASTSVQNKEPEDAYLTGGQRNLQRRVLGLNVEANQSQRPAGQSPGLHSTGSFTGVANGQDEAEDERKEKAS
jgi:hypothetical protein